MPVFSNLFDDGEKASLSGVVSHGVGFPLIATGLYVDTSTGAIWLNGVEVATHPDPSALSKALFWGSTEPIGVTSLGERYLRVKSDGSIVVHGPATLDGWPSLGQGGFTSGSGVLPPTFEYGVATKVTAQGFVAESVVGEGIPYLAPNDCWTVEAIGVANNVPSKLPKTPAKQGVISTESLSPLVAGVVPAGAISISWTNKGSTNALVDGDDMYPGQVINMKGVANSTYDAVSYDPKSTKLTIRIERVKT